MTYAFGDLSCTRSRTLGLGQWGSIGKYHSFPWHRGKAALKVMLSMSYFVWRSTYHQLTKFDFEILGLNTRGTGGQMNSPKRRKIFNYLKKHSSPKSIIFLQETHVQKRLRMNGEISRDVAEVGFFSHMVLQIVKVSL